MTILKTDLVGFGFELFFNGSPHHSAPSQLIHRQGESRENRSQLVRIQDHQQRADPTWWNWQYTWSVLVTAVGQRGRVRHQNLPQTIPLLILSNAFKATQTDLEYENHRKVIIIQTCLCNHVPTRKYYLEHKFYQKNCLPLFLYICISIPMVTIIYVCINVASFAVLPAIISLINIKCLTPIPSIIFIVSFDQVYQLIINFNLNF